MTREEAGSWHRSALIFLVLSVFTALEINAMPCIGRCRAQGNPLGLCITVCLVNPDAF